MPEPGPGPFPGLLEVGRIGKPHGVRGELVVGLLTDRTERLAPGSRLLTAAGRTLVVESSRPFQDRWLVHFEGVFDRTAAEALRGELLHAEPVDGGDDELWVHELIGADVVDVSGERLGRCTAIEANPAADLVVIDGTRLVPMNFVVEAAGGRIVVDPPEGLFEAQA